MKRILAFFVLVSALLVPASLALGASSLPKPTSSKLVVPTSLAGVKTGMSEAAAKAAWGERGTCATSSYSGRSRCEYGDTSGSTGSAYIECADGKVVNAVVYSGRNAANILTASASGILGKMKTSDGLGLGSKFSTLKSAYPKGQIEEATDESFNFTIKGRGRSKFVFGILSPSKRVYSFAVVEESAQ
jgi:hypothetical protein